MLGSPLWCWERRREVRVALLQKAKEIVVRRISEEASCVGFSPSQPGLAELAGPTKLSQRGPEGLCLLPRSGPQARR